MAQNKSTPHGRWMDTLQQVKDFAVEKNRLPRPETPLGKWCSFQRRNRADGRLSRQQLDALYRAHRLVSA